MSDDAETQVKEMAKLVIYSNKISEIHEKNMKMYPFVFFEGIKSVKIDYNLERIDDVNLDKLHNLTINKPTNASYVKYILDIDTSIEQSNIDRRFAALEASIRTLFWKNIVVEIVFNDKTVYKSKL